MYSIYIIESQRDKRLYVGMSQNVKKRIKEHNTGYVFSTKGYRPWKLVYSELVGSRVGARIKEKYYKSGSGKEYIKNVILHRYNKLDE